MFLSGMRRAGLCAALTLFAASAAASSVEPFAFKARAGVLIDAETGATLAEKNADERIPPASMSKLMTVYMVFDALKSGAIGLEDETIVSKSAFRKGGSTMFLKLGQSVRVVDLIRGVVVQSGNDAAIALAELLGADEARFAAQMTRRAAELGLTGSRFANATGWPAPDHYMTARDIARISLLLIRDHPQYFPIYSEVEFTFNGVTQGNRNPILYGFEGGDGLKTGHTEEAGYGLAATAKRGGRRLISVVSGLPSMRARKTESELLLNWGFRNFDNVALFAAGETIFRAPVWMGDAPRVGLATAEDLVVTVPRGLVEDLQTRVAFTSPIPAPIVGGAVAGDARLEVVAGGEVVATAPLIAQRGVGRAGPVGRVMAVAEYYLFGPGL